MINLAKRLSILALILAFVSSTELNSCGQQAIIVKDAILKISEEREVPSLVSGVVAQSQVREGSLVVAGNSIMEIDDRQIELEMKKLKKEYEMAVQDASSTVELDFAASSIAVAQAEFGRAVQSNQRRPGAVANSEIDQLRLLVERSIAEKNKTEFEIRMKKMLTEVRGIELASGKKRLKDHQIAAPISGLVVEILKKPGEWVEASEGVARIVQMKQLKVEALVPARLALGHLVGSSVTFTPKLETLKGNEYPGKVLFTDPEANPVNEKLRVWVEIENANLDLVPGLVGDLSIQQADETETPDIDSNSQAAVEVMPLPDSE